MIPVVRRTDLIMQPYSSAVVIRGSVRAALCVVGGCRRGANKELHSRQVATAARYSNSFLVGWHNSGGNREGVSMPEGD